MYKATSYHVPGYLRDDVTNPKIDDITVIVFTNGLEKFPIKDIKAGISYVPVYEDLEECDKVVKKMIQEHRDPMFIICSFESVGAVNEKVKSDFTETVKLIVRESKK